jgi:hypothetical protein
MRNKIITQLHCYCVYRVFEDIYYVVKVHHVVNIGANHVIIGY